LETEEPLLNVSDVRAILEARGLSVAEGSWEKMENWVEILEVLNRRVNLVSQQEIPRIWSRHLLPCLSLLKLRDIPNGIEFCDFGSGGGFPGIPLAICRPDLRMVLLDARRRKCDALEEMTEALGLENVEVIWGRGEELGKTKAWRGRFSAISARAVASLERIEAWTREIRQADAEIHIFKGGDLEEEYNALKKNRPDARLNQTLLDFDEFPFLRENQKYLITLTFPSK
jgi:16S rRNA (guanine527-N7)-methyltransferase